MVIIKTSELYIPDEELPEYASQIVDDLQQYHLEDINLDLISDAIYGDFTENYYNWSFPQLANYEIYEDKMVDLIKEELARRGETIQDY